MLIQVYVTAVAISQLQLVIATNHILEYKITPHKYEQEKYNFNKFSVSFCFIKTQPEGNVN